MYESDVALNAWNHIIVYYNDEFGNKIPLTYKTATLQGSITDEFTNGADWVNSFYHEIDENGVDTAEYGKFWTCNDLAGYYICFDANTMTLTFYDR